MNNEYKTAKELHKIINDLQLELQKLKVEKRRWMFKNKECKEYYDIQDKIQVLEIDLYKKMNHLIDLQYIIIETLEN